MGECTGTAQTLRFRVHLCIAAPLKDDVTQYSNDKRIRPFFLQEIKLLGPS